MSLRDLARLAMKIAGLVIIVSALSTLPYSLGRLIAETHYPGTLPLILMTIAPAGLSVAVGLALFWGSNRIVDRILVIPSVEPETSHALLPKLEEIVLAGLDR
ncbi:MAG TPA: hypothetical protein VGM59_08265 [Dongiaceae bacterium]